MVAVHQPFYELTQNESDFYEGIWNVPEKILSIQAAPRGRRGATEIICEGFLRGVEEQGKSIQRVYLADLIMTMCKGCFKCWKGPESKCPIVDDLSSLIPTVPSYDLIVLSTPLYVDGIPAILKNFIDRAMILNHPSVVYRDGHYLHPSMSPRLPNIFLISACALPGRKNFQLLDDYLQSVGRHMHMPVVGKIFRPETMSFMHRTGMEMINELKRNLLDAGIQVVRKGVVEPELETAISRPILSEQEYFNLSNEWWR